MEISPCFLLCVERGFQHPFHLGRKKRDWEERKVVPNCIYLFTLFPPSDHTYRKRTTSGPSSRCKCGPGSKLTQSLVQYFNLRSLQVSVYSDNGTTYFYNPDEQLSSQLATGGVSPRKKSFCRLFYNLTNLQAMGGSILLPNWSAYSGTPSQMVALKVLFRFG